MKCLRRNDDAMKIDVGIYKDHPYQFYFLKMKCFFLPIVFLFAMHDSFAQTMQLPEPVTNLAAAALQKNEASYIYTFYGLDSTRKWSGVHNKVFRISLATGQSELVGRVPDSIGRLASSAATIKNKAYITGGYTVFQNGKEYSSKYLFIFDPITETFTKGAELPISIDDHIQTVWRDSLLYLISGWSDSANVRIVQVYNPFTNQWRLATSLPNEKTAAVFGGCGTIVGDTIYILGGAVFDKFYPPSGNMYKGAIDPENPLQITWINAGEYPGEFRYRSAAYTMANKIFFFGGSNETYNYNGISYKEKKPVEPNKTVLIYDIYRGTFTFKQVLKQVMDIRNIVLSVKNKFYIVGGMGPHQKISADVISIKIK